MKTKLPRKRKKAFIKKYSQSDYKLSIMAIEVTIEKDPTLDNKFVKTFGKGLMRFKAASFW